MSGCTLFLLKPSAFDKPVEAGNFNLVALLHGSKYEVCPLMLLTGLGVLWEKQPRKLEALDCRSRRNIIGKLKEIRLRSFISEESWFVDSSAQSHNHN